MAQIQYAMAREPRDPMTAAMLSLVPGLGQFYNGESRKGILFLDVAFINFVLLSIVLLAPVFVKGMQMFGEKFGMRINSGVLEALKNLQIGSPVSLVVLGMVLAFVAYAVRDAYDHAMIKRRRAIYSDSILQLDEATSGSYIIHASIIVSLAVMALFFFIPKPLAKQIVEIEFLNSIKETIVTPPRTTTISEHNVKRTVPKVDLTKPVQKTQPKAEMSKQPSTDTKTATTPTKTSSTTASSSSSPPQAKPIQPKQADPARAMAAAPAQQTMEKPTLMALAPPILQPIRPATAPAAMAPNPIKSLAPTMPAPPKVQPINMGSNPAMPMMIANNHGTVTAAPLPLPSAFSPAGLARSSTPAMPLAGSAPSSGSTANQFKFPGMGSMPDLGSGNRVFVPKASTGTASTPGHSNTGGPTMLDIPTSKTGPGGPGGPSPEAMNKSGKSRKNGSDEVGDSDIPAPVKAGHHQKSGDYRPISIIPSSGPIQSGPGAKVEPSAGPLGPGTSDTRKDPDFSEYMRNLQRRIKQAWSPPRDGQSRRVKVMFKIHENGQMSNLRISSGSGIATADQAALEAINHAAPFAHLPPYAPENVDIEFTFDYNLFSGKY